MPANASPFWFITGCSSGLGGELADRVLARGWRGAITARDKARVADLANDAGDRAPLVDPDVTDPAQIAAAVRAAEARFGVSMCS